MTPRFWRESSPTSLMRLVMALNAPRALKAPMRWWLSSFRNKLSFGGGREVVVVAAEEDDGGGGSDQIGGGLSERNERGSGWEAI